MSYYTKHWGQAQTQKKIAEGIMEYTTASHGGFEISAERMLQMPAKYRACSFTEDNCFEEDCSWCAVVLTWPQYFEPRIIEAAESTFNNFYNQKVAA